MILPTSILCLLIILIVCISFDVCTAIECKFNSEDSSKVAYTIVVDKTSHDTKYRKIQDAIDSIPTENDEWIKIHVRAGIYQEKVSIPYEKECIVLEGEGRDKTIITSADHDATDTSATFSSSADNFVARDISFENSYNRNRNGDLKPALAARIYGDKSAFYRCGFIGMQDTLWDVMGRHYFKLCYIEGAIDFIFGDGQSLYEVIKHFASLIEQLVDALGYIVDPQEGSKINVSIGSLPPQYMYSYITAQGRQSPNDTSGFVFEGGFIYGTRQAFLGRAYGPYSRVIYHGMTINMNIVPEGWDAWNYQGHESNFTYSEIQCKGMGSDTSKRVPWAKNPTSMSDQFKKTNFINQDGWIERQP